MYTEEPKKDIDWGNVIKKGLIIVAIAIVVIVIIGLFAKKNPNSNINVYDGGNSSVNNQNPSGSITNSNAYSKEFIDGYRYFHDTAKEYFLISELPNANQTLKYTLQQLIDKGLMLPFSYKDNKACDAEASYALVKNENGTYHMTIMLVCGNEVAKTTEELGCNQLCTGSNGKCDVTVIEPTEDEKILEYRYKQPYTVTDTIYTCEAGFTRSGTKCIKDNKDTVPASKKVTYKCPEGYTSVGEGENMTCTKGTTSTKDPIVSYTYKCPEGYAQSGSGENTKCYKKTENSIPAKENTIYKCPEGYTQSGSGANTKCTKTITTTKNATANNDYSYSCQIGTLSGSQCRVTSSTPAQASTTYDYYCDYGTWNGTTCVYSATNSKSTYYDCSAYKNATNLQNGKCRVTETTKTSGGYTFSDSIISPSGCSYSGLTKNVCPSCSTKKYAHYCSGSTTTKTVDKDAQVKTNNSYSCPYGGTVSGSQCLKGAKAKQNVTYSCPNGGRLSGTQCLTDGYIPADINTKTTYKCSEGILNGTTCTITTTQTANPSVTKEYYCEDKSYSLSGDRCYKTTNEEKPFIKETKKSCENGYTLSGDKCISNGTITKRPSVHTEYLCQEGYTKYGLGSDSKCTKGEVITVDAHKSTQTTTKYRYQWSTETSLPGWERTGETRYTTKASK